MKLKDRVIVVTGGASGMGREMVLQLLGRGALAAAVDINEAALQELVELAGGKREGLSTHVVNITDRAAVEALPGQVVAAHGAVDGLINNAGIIQPFVRVNELDYAAIDRVMDVNFYGTLYMTKAFLPHLLARPEAHLANVSSMGGFLPVPGQSIYGASKAAVKLLTEGLHSELANTNVHVTIIFPGSIGTNIAANSGIDVSAAAAESGGQSFKTMDPAEAARAMLDGIEKDSYRVLVGSDAKMMDLLYRLTPKGAANLIFKQMQSLLGE
jgi:NAD(P)-dependent dehydrogenase (short-subunit alcohol dehydrogenase family)